MIQSPQLLNPIIWDNMQYTRYAIKFDITAANPKRFTWTDNLVWWLTYEPTVHYDDFRFARLFDSEKSANIELRNNRYRMYGTIVPVICTL